MRFLTTHISIHFPLIIMSISILVGCGTEEKPSDTNTDTEEALFAGSMAIKSKADIPECLDINKQQLVYVKDEGQFYVCEAAGWEKISIAGAKGEKGDTGSTGATGAAGRANMDVSWTDSNTSLTWYIGSSVIETVNTCSSGYTMPTNAQALTAFANGLGSVMGVGYWCIWANTTGGADNAVESTNTTVIDTTPPSYCHSLCYK